MTLHADYEVIPFWEHLGDTKDDIKTSAKFCGDQTTVKEFYIGQVPTGMGFLTLQTYDVHNSGHHIQINGKELSGMDLPKHPAENRWDTWTEIIDNNLLKKGTNTIQVTRAGSGDNLIVKNIVVNWREQV